MSEVASAYVSLIPSYRGGTSAISKELSPGLDAAGESAGKSMGGRISSGIGGFLKKSVIGVGVAAGGVLATALVKGFGRLTAIENATAKLTGLGNSAKSVQTIMDNALASVKGTAFGLDEAATVSASAVAAGIKPGKDLTATLRLVADAATIGGSSLTDMGAIFNKVAASNKLQGDTIDQLNEQGIPIVQFLAKTLGKTNSEVVSLASAGKIGFADFSKAMQAGLGGAALKSGATTQGAFKNSQAALGRFGASLLSGLFPIAKVVFGGITTLLDSLTSKVTPFADAFAGGLTGTVIPALQVGYGVVKDFYGGIAGGAGSITAASSSASALGASFNTAFQSIKPAIVAQLSTAFATIKTTIATLKPYLDQLWSKFGPAVSATLPAILQLAQALNPVSLIFHAILPVLPQFADAFGKIAVALADAILPVLPPLVTALAAVAGAMTGALSGALGTVLPLVGSLAAGLAPVAPYALAAFGAFKGAQAAVSGVQSVKETVTGAIDSVKGFRDEVVDNIDSVKQFGSDVKDGAKKLRDWGSSALSAAKGAASTAKSVTLAAAAYVRQGVAAVASAIRTAASTVASLAASAAAKAWAAAQFILNAALEANPIGLVILAITALVGIFILAWKNSETFRDIVKAAFAAILSVGQTLWTGLQAVFNGIGVAVGVIASIFQFQFNLIKTIVLGVFNGIRAVISAVIGAVITVVRVNLAVIKGVFSTVFGAVRTVVSGAINGVKGFVSGGLNAIVGTVTKIGGGISRVWNSIWNGLSDTVETAVSTIGGVVAAIWDGVTSGLKGALNGAIRILNDAISFINNKLIHTANKIPGVDIPNIPKIPELAKGGIIPATPGGRIVRVAEAGQAEAVIPLDKLNGMTGGRDAPVIAGDLVLNEVTDPVGTARAVSRRLAHLGA